MFNGVNIGSCGPPPFFFGWILAGGDVSRYRNGAEFAFSCPARLGLPCTTEPALHDWASTVNCVPAGAADLSALGHDNISKYRILFKTLRVRRTTTSSPHSLVQHLAGSPHLSHSHTIPLNLTPVFRPWRGGSSLLSLHADGGVLLQPAGRICTRPICSSSGSCSSHSRLRLVVAALPLRRVRRSTISAVKLPSPLWPIPSTPIRLCYTGPRVFRSWFAAGSLPRLDALLLLPLTLRRHCSRRDLSRMDLVMYRIRKHAPGDPG